MKSDFRCSNTIVYNNFPWPDLVVDTATPSPQPSPARGRGGKSAEFGESGVITALDLAQTSASQLTSLSKTELRDEKLKTAIESAAQGVLDARAAHPESSLADLYDPVAMPPDLVKAHQKLDAAVDAAYFAAHAAEGAKKTWRNDAERVAFLFTLYQKFTSFLPVDSVKAKRGKKTA